MAMAETNLPPAQAHNAPQGLIEGFERRRLPGDGITIDALVGGSGPPLLLLHGYPQTRMAWRAVAPELARHFTLVIPDLRGCGRSDKPVDDAGHQTYSKRRMARDQVATMAALGFARFFVAGHDRGGRVAYRLALDHPEAVERLAVIDIVPTVDVFEGTAASAMALFHWSFLAQPHPLPEQLLAGRTDAFLAHLFSRWTAPGFVFEPASMHDYLQCFQDPATVHATCSDYRAAWAVDRHHDQQDRDARRTLGQPLQVLWGSHGTANAAGPMPIWNAWAAHATGQAIRAGHFVPEEAPAETAAALRHFFSATQ
jgi:haloacetate dehalogenase